MSASHNQSHQLNPISENYIKEVLDKKEKCPRRQCKGTLIDVLVRYENQGTISREKECSECSKIFRKDRVRKYNNFKKNNRNKYEDRSNRR